MRIEKYRLEFCKQCQRWGWQILLIDFELSFVQNCTFIFHHNENIQMALRWKVCKTEGSEKEAKQLND